MVHIEQVKQLREKNEKLCGERRILHMKMEQRTKYNSEKKV